MDLRPYKTPKDFYEILGKVCTAQIFIHPHFSRVAQEIQSRGELDMQSLENSLKQVIANDEKLRTQDPFNNFVKYIPERNHLGELKGLLLGGSYRNCSKNALPVRCAHH